MTMNYVGSVTVIDRGDAPAQAVMDRNARSLAQRVADETRDELEKVLSRVENIYGSFEMSSEYNSDNLEYVNDIGELEELIRDQVKKRKYQQQVTIFVVGFQDVCGQKLRLLQQVNEFFMENSKSYEEEDWFPRTPDIDLDDVVDKIEESLTTAHDLTNRLGELNKEIVDCLAAYAEKKATNRGKKKLERALQMAKDEVGNLSEKLLGIQSEIEEKDEKMQALFKQLEVKNLELQRFKTAAEVAKKNVQDSERLQAEISARDEKIQELRQKINHIEIELTSSNHTQELSQSKLASASEENQHRIVQLTKEVEEGKMAMDEAKRDLLRSHESQMSSLKESHHTAMEEMKSQHAEEMQQLVEELERTKQELIAAQHRAAQLQLSKGDRSDTASDVTRHFDLDPSEPPSQDTTREGSRQDSRSNKSSRQGSVASKKSGKSPNRQSESKPGSRASVKQGGDQQGKDIDEVVDITSFTPPDSKKELQKLLADDIFTELVHRIINDFPTGYPKVNPSSSEIAESTSDLQHVQVTEENNESELEVAGNLECTLTQAPAKSTSGKHGKLVKSKPPAKPSAPILAAQKDLAAEVLKKYRFSKDSQQIMESDVSVAEDSILEEDKTMPKETEKTMTLVQPKLLIPIQSQPAEKTENYVTRKEFLELQEEVRQLRRQLERKKPSATISSLNSASSLPSVSLPVAPPLPSVSLSVAPPLPCYGPLPSAASPIHSPSATPLSPEVKFNGHTKNELRDMISFCDKLLDAVKILMEAVFSEEYILSHSISGRPSNSHHLAKPQFDIRLFGVVKSVLKSKFTTASDKDITAKVHSVQRTKLNSFKKL